VVVRLERDAGDEQLPLLVKDALDTLSSHGASALVIDLAGLDVVDGALIRCIEEMSRGAQCLGAQPLVAGVAPGVAVTLVDLDVDRVLPACARSVEDAVAMAGRALRSRR
jgi:rsbT co-antagonist protein RsbR